MLIKYVDRHECFQRDGGKRTMRIAEDILVSLALEPVTTVPDSYNGGGLINGPPGGGTSRSPVNIIGIDLFGVVTSTIKFQ